MQLKDTQEQQVAKLLKGGWYTNYGMQIALKSSSADRAFRRLRAKGLEGWEIKQRIKKDAPVRCYEYRIFRKEA